MKTISQSQIHGGLDRLFHRMQLAVQRIDVTKVNCPVGIIFATQGQLQISQSPMSPRPVELNALERTLEEMIAKAHRDWAKHLHAINERPANAHHKE